MSRKASVKGKKDKSIQKQRTNKKNQPKQPDRNRPGLVWAEKITLAIMLIVVTLILIVGPFERGLFFQRELLLASAVIFGLLIIWGIFRYINKNNSLISAPLDICLIILLLAYFVSFFVAAHKRDALDEVLKIAAYLVIYFVAQDICRYWSLPWKNKESQLAQDSHEPSIPPGLGLILHIVMASAIIITVASLGAAAGQWDFIGAYAGNRIASPMGYANTAAAYLMAAYLLTLGLAPLATRWFKLLYLAPASLMLMTVILTFSRGAWLLLPPLAILLVIASAKSERLRSFLYILVTAAAAVPAAFILDPLFRSGTLAQAWVIISAVAIAAVLMGLLAELYIRQNRKMQVVLAGAGLVVVIVTFIAAIVIPLMSPVHLERSLEEPAQIQSVSQVIGKVKAGQSYKLSFEIDADQTPRSGAEETEYAWGVRVLGGVPGYQDETLLDVQGSSTSGWEEREFRFNTSKETTRLEVQFYNQYPGTAATIRSIYLGTDEYKQNLRFVVNRVLPKRFYDRVYSYSRDRNMDRRFELFGDAIKVIRDYPILGVGGGGWKALYHSYQDQAYISNEVHNHYLQVWIESGILGFLAFIGIWISFTAAFIKNCIIKRAPPRVWQFWTASLIPVIALGTHSIIDWNFSMAAVGIFLFVLLGAGRSLDQHLWFDIMKSKKDGSGRKVGIVGITAVGLGLALLFLTITLINGLYTTGYSQELLERNNLKQSINEMQRAIKLDPYRADNYHNLNILLEEQFARTQNPADLETILQLSERAYELEPFNPRYVSRYGDLLLRYVDIEQGLSHIDRVIDLRPLSESSYYDPGWARLSLIEFFVERGDRRTAEIFLKELLQHEQTMIKNYGTSEPIAYILGRAYFSLGDYQDATYYFQTVSEENHIYEESLRHLELIRGNEQGNDEIQ